MSASQLELIANQVKHLPPDDLIKLIKQAIELLEQKRTASFTPSETISTASMPRYAALFGSGKGLFASAEDADEYLRAERDQWEE
ncbi:MAG: hypothetical protein JNJ50_32485 [Acidobacteria bacterium]|nr:hypothetical protein [Acidobacteriota bacterium]